MKYYKDVKENNPQFQFYPKSLLVFVYILLGARESFLNSVENTRPTTDWC